MVGGRRILAVLPGLLDHTMGRELERVQFLEFRLGVGIMLRRHRVPRVPRPAAEQFPVFQRVLTSRRAAPDLQRPRRRTIDLGIGHPCKARRQSVG
jgi:hypothetical protein